MSRSTSLFALFLLVAACNRPETAPAPGAQATLPAKQAAKAAVPNALVGAPGLELVPRDALFVAATGPVDQVLVRLGHAGFVKALGAVYLEAAAEVTRATGRNLVDPAAWGEMGVDLSKPLVFGWLDGPREVVLFAVTLRDPKAFEAAILGLFTRGKETVVREVVGDAVVLHPKDEREVNLLIRGQRAALVVTDRADEDGILWTTRVAELKPEASMASNAAAAEELKALGSGREAGGWINTTALVGAIVEDMTRDRSAEWDERTLERARAQGDQEAIARVEANIRERRMADPLAAARRKAKAALARGFFAGIGGVSIGVTADGPALRVAARVPLTAESLPRAVLAPGKGALRLPLAWHEGPLFLGTGRVNVQGAVDRLQAIALAAGETRDLERAREEARRELGLDLSDMPALLDGEVGLVVTLKEVESSRRFLGFLDGLRGAGLLGLKDTGRVDAVFRAAATRSGAPVGADGLVRAPILKNVTLVAGVSGEYLAGSTDEGAFTRVGSGDGARSFVKGLKSAQLQALFGRPDPAQLWAFDFGSAVEIGIGERMKDAARTLRAAIGPTAARVDLDEEALRIDGGQFVGTPTVAEAVAAFGAFIEAMERR